MSYREITLVEMPRRSARVLAAENEVAARYRMLLVAAFLPAAAILVTAAIIMAKLLAA
jgi:hypothetical protein